MEALTREIGMGHRFMFQNLIDDETVITAASVEKGFVGAGVPRVAGAGGSMIFSGAYTGEDQEVYSAEIEAPGDVGIARFRWRKTSTPAGGWEASNIPTALTDIPLDAGVKIRFVDGADSPAFALGDRWQATANRFYSPRRIYDLDPATKMRSASAPEDPWSLVLDFGAAGLSRRIHRPPPQLPARRQSPDSGRPLRQTGARPRSMKGSPGAPARSSTISPPRRVHTATGVFWPKAPPTKPPAHLEVSEIYLGGFFEPADHFWFGNVVGEESFEETSRTENMAERPVLLNRGRTITLPYERISDAQRGAFLAMYRAVKDVDAGRAKPFFVHLDVDDPASVILAHLAGGFLPRQIGPDDSSFELVLRERLA